MSDLLSAVDARTIATRYNMSNNRQLMNSILKHIQEAAEHGDMSVQLGRETFSNFPEELVKELGYKVDVFDRWIKISW